MPLASGSCGNRPMNPAGPEIGYGSQVCLHYAIGLPAGPELETSFGAEPLCFTVGDGTLSQGLEYALLGLRPGQEQALRIAGELAYGPRDEANVHFVPLDRFPPGVDPQPGQVIAFAGPAGEHLAGTVLTREADQARVDFNPPLAGREILFRVRILRVTPAPE
jgi:FKBP-type peptidyl-prolyl cis-trans isomerase SlpA